MRRLPRATAGVLAARHPRLAGRLRRAAAWRQPGDRTVARRRGAHRPLRAGAGDPRLAAPRGAARRARGDARGHDRDAVARKGLRHRRGLRGGRACARTAARVPHPGPVGGAVAGAAAVAHCDDRRVRGRRPRRAARRRTSRRALVSRAVARDLDLHAFGRAGGRLADRGVGPRRACRAPRRPRRRAPAAMGCHGRGVERRAARRGTGGACAGTAPWSGRIPPIMPSAISHRFARRRRTGSDRVARARPAAPATTAGSARRRPAARGSRARGNAVRPRRGARGARRARAARRRRARGIRPAPRARRARDRGRARARGGTRDVDHLAHDRTGARRDASRQGRRGPRPRRRARPAAAAAAGIARDDAAARRGSARGGLARRAQARRAADGFVRRSR